MSSIDWEKVTKSINGFYGTSLTEAEVEDVFQRAWEKLNAKEIARDIIEKHLLTHPEIQSNRDMYGRRRRDPSLF